MSRGRVQAVAGRVAVVAALAAVVLGACSRDDPAVDAGVATTATPTPTTSIDPATTAPTTATIVLPTVPSDTSPEVTTTLVEPVGGGGSTVAVRIVAVELQPEDPSPGGQLVVLVNVGSSVSDLSCWRLRSSATGAEVALAERTRLAPSAALRVIPEGAAFAATDLVELVDDHDVVVDATPELSDRHGDDQLWFRDAADLWQFGRTDLPQPMTDAQLVDLDDC